MSLRWSRTGCLAWSCKGRCSTPGNVSTPRAFRHWLADLPRERPALLVSEVPEWFRAGPRRVRRTMRLDLADRLEDTLQVTPDQQVPVDVVVGEHDPLSTLEGT